MHCRQAAEPGYERHRRWSADGTWQLILEELQVEADAAYLAYRLSIYLDIMH
jgi:hypothetical protein